jgi:hypothetical protein
MATKMMQCLWKICGADFLADPGETLKIWWALQDSNL